MRKLIFIALTMLLLCQYVIGWGQQRKGYIVGFYNLENLFDTTHDKGKNDHEFLPNGGNKWTDVKYKKKLANMAKVIQAMAKENGAFHTVLGVAEIENRHVLEDLVKQNAIAKANYQIVHYEGPDKRGVDVALLYRPDKFQYIESKAIPFTFDSKNIDFSSWTKEEKDNFKTRDILMVRGTIDGEMFAFLVGHYPSRIGGKGEDLRPRAAEIMYAEAQSLMMQYPGIKIVAMGDMNDNPTDISMTDYMRGKENITQVGSEDFFSPFLSMIKAGYGTLAYRGTWNIFDIILVNKALCNNNPNTLHIVPIVKNEYYGRIFKQPFMVQQDGPYKGTPFRTFSGGDFIGGYSDHYPTYILIEKGIAPTKQGKKGQSTFNTAQMQGLRQGAVQDQENEIDLSDGGYNDSPVILYGENDVFNNQAGFNFSSVRFRQRGYNSESQDVSLAGVPMNDAITGYTPYSLWSGLNEATRAKSSVTGAELSSFGVGGYNGLTNIDGMASSVRKGLRGSILTNSAFYRLRLMLTYASGNLDNGWSYAVSGSARLGGNDYVQGVYYRSFAYYLSAEKKFNDKHKLGFTFLATPGSRGVQNGATQEVYNLVGNNMYNSNWGYQNGKIRNAKVRNTNEPIAILKYDYTPSTKFNLTTTLLYRFGKNGYTALDWYDAPDPRPDYYRNLPSYFMVDNDDYNKKEEEKYNFVKDAWEYNINNIRHINWDRFYEVNSNNIVNNSKRSKYVVEERRVDQKDLNIAINALWNINSAFTMRGGFIGKLNKTENYKVLYDLLGGDYFEDIDQFAERDFPADKSKIQNDLQYYNQHGQQSKVIKKGDKYGYDYNAIIHKAKLWWIGEYNKGGLEAGLGLTFGNTSFYRKGLVEKGLFPGDTSLGKSKKNSFITYSTKLNLAYNFNGGHRVQANVGYFNDAPTFNQAFLSPRTRNSVIDNLNTIKTFTSDLNYYYINNGYNIRATAYYTDIMNQSNVMSFFDDQHNSFTNFAMTGIDERHLGIEIGFRVPTPITAIALQGALSLGKFYYTSNSKVTQTLDNSNKVLISNELLPYWKSNPTANGGKQQHFVPGTPQTAASLGLSYNKNYWFIDVDVNYFARNYLSMNPLYRTDLATMGPDLNPTPQEIDYMASQEKFKPAFLLNFSVGKSWYIKYKYQLGFNLNARNLLNNKNVITGGFEQTRLITKTASSERYYKFDPKYFYMCGFNYMLNVYFRF